MVDTPEKIWAYHNGNSQTYLTAPNKFHNVEYVRADIAASQLAESRAAHQKTSHKAVKRLRALWREKEAAEAERDRLAADNARLREALGEIEQGRPELKSNHDYSRGWNDAFFRVSQIARAALAGKE